MTTQTEGRINPILPLIMSCGSASFRQDVSRVLKDVSLPPPYDSCFEELLSRKGQLKEDSLIKLAGVYLHDHEMSVLRKLGEFDTGLGLQYLEELVATRNLERIERMLSEDGTPASVLARIKDQASTSLALVQQPRAKKLGQLDKSEEEYMFEWLRYKWAKKKLYLLCAYSGIGKTSLSLALANLCAEMGLTTLYISVKDWSESSMYHKVAAGHATGMDKVWFAIYSECSIFQVESEIRLVKPDVVIVDSLKSISNYYADEDRMFIELGKRADTLRVIANDYNCCAVTTHQLVVMEEVVIPQHLQGAKSHLLEHCDLALGVGVAETSQKDRVISTLKVRNAESVPPFRIMIDHDTLEIEDIGKYVSPDSQKGRLRTP